MATHGDRTARQTGTNEIQGQVVDYEQFIDNQLRKTRSHVRGVDVAGSLMTLAAGTLAYFFLAGIVDHWIISGGLGFAGRLIFLAIYAAAALYYVLAQVLPLLLRRINPLYAAYTIERSRPSLKNGLVNFLWFRANPRGLPSVVYQAIEEQAATNLAKVHVEAAVDRSKLIHIGYALVGILLVCALYTLLSPKDLLKTVGRVVMPWAEINAPTRTTIVEIEPGDAQAFRGQQVTVAARIQSLPSDGKVMLYYTTADGQTVDRAVEMNLPPDGYKHACVLPAGDGSLQQSLAYRIEAGDAITRAYQIEVVAAPTIVVQNVAYKYPPYTGLLAQRVEHQGDIKAIEGTEITIHAVANQDIQSAQVDFDCDGKLDLRMQTDKQEASATFVLALRDDRKTPLHNCYQLMFKNDQGQQNPQSVRHQIEVTRDLPPEIQFVAPKKDETDLPANGAVELEVVANDPDFGLRIVKLSATSNKRPLVDKVLLDEVWRGQFGKKIRFDARKLGLKSGDIVEYSALAEDNKDPRPNRTETAKRRIRIVSPSAQPSKSDRLAQNRQQRDNQQPEAEGDRGDNDHPRDNDQPQDSDEKDQKPQKPDPQNAGKSEDRAPSDGDDQRPGEVEQDADHRQADQAEGSATEQRPGEKGDKPGTAQPSDENVPNDGSDDASAIEKILQHREEQEKPNPKSPDDPRQQRQSEQQKAGGKEKPGDKDGTRRQQPGQDGKDAQSPEPGKGDQSADDGQQKSDAQPDDNEPAGQQPGDEQAGDKAAEKQQRPANKQPDKSDRSQGQAGQKGAGAGDNGEGNDSGGGQDGEKGQAGQKGQSGKSSSQGKGKGEHPGDAGANPAGEKSQQGGKSQGKSGDAKSGNSKAPDKAGRDEPGDKGQGAAQGQGTSPDKPEGARDPQATDEQGQGDKSKSNGGKPTGKSDSAGEGRGEKPDRDAKPDKKPAGKADEQPADRDAQGSDARDESTPDGKKQPGDARPGQGEKSKGDASREANQEPSPDKQNSDAKGGDGEKEQGAAGAGQKGQDNKGSPSPMDQNQARDKSQRASPDEKDPKPGEDAQSPSTSQKESDSQGLDDGDRSGGGKKGGGQKANKSGTGGAGQNTPADEGAGRSGEAGMGETSDRPGGDSKADKKTGRSGSQSGEGSSTAPSGDGDKPGSGKPSQGAGAGSKSPPAGGDNQPDQSGSQPSGPPGDGKPGQDAKSVKQKWQPGQDQADQANLEYARKSTDLALEHLKDELRKDRPDPELLNRLGWTKKDLESFVKRWEQMRKQSQAPGEKGTQSRQELDETLRSLGLRPRATSLKSKATRDDQLQGVKESRHTTPPPEYLEQSKAYSQGTARGGK